MGALVEMRGVTRHFGAVRANDGIDLDVRSGEILGLLGENGSGKSTLMKVLFGVTKADSGEMRFRGRLLSRHNPAAAMAAGMAMIHQHFMLVEAMSVLDNVMLGLREAGFWLRRGEMRARVIETSRRFGLDLDPDAFVADLPLGRRQRVEILKAVLREADLLILDEPTSNLAPAEVAELLAVLSRLRGEGKAVVLITHKLPEVMEACDRVVVLRAGRVAGEAIVDDVTKAQLAQLMVGRDTTALRPARSGEPGSERLVVRDLVAAGLGPVSFSVRAGEVLGVAGVDGNGQNELVETLAGLRPAVSGSTQLDGADLTRASVGARVEAGLAYMPADRSATALVKRFSIAENLMLRDSGRAPYARRGWLAPSALRRKAVELMRDYDIRAPGPQTPTIRLSGGNQQKIVIARELDRKPAALIAHQAAWGLDPGATRFVIDEILALRDAGAAVLYLSSELDEVLEVADRVAVIANGRLAGVVERGAVNLNEIGLWMSGRAA